MPKIVPPERLALALRLFEQMDSSNATMGDLLFNIFGLGNLLDQVSQPYERFCWYEELLTSCQAQDATKYLAIHKGTAFYFMCWLALDLRNYESGLFYIDAAMSEDVRRAPAQWLTEPAGKFITLDDPKNQVAGRHVERIRTLLEAHITRFCSLSGHSLSLVGVINRFVKRFVQQVEHRTIISAWYVHLLEFEDRFAELKLRSSGGGSIAPFLDHLFRGGLILESVLKHFYPRSTGSTLGGVYQDPTFKKDFGGPFQNSAHAIVDVVAALGLGFEQDAFSTTAKLRNTAGHNLVWDDALTPAVFQQLYEQEVNAMLLVVAKKC